MQTELAVIGAGPAGMAAAVTAAEAGLRVVLVDAGSSPGGQYFRHSKAAPKVSRPAGWESYLALRARMYQMQGTGQLTYLSRSQVWSLSEEGEEFVVRCQKGERAPVAIELRAPRLVLATGAYDRVLPFPGWQLPGSVSLGAAQAMVKGNATLLGQRVVVAGTGPFLLAVAADLVKAGAEVAAVVEAASFGALGADPRALWLGRDKIGVGLRYLGTLRRHGARMLDQARLIEALGDGRVTSVRVETNRGPLEFDCDLVATGWGFTPQLELAVALGLSTAVDSTGTLVAVVDDEQTSSHPRVWVAGEGTGVAGAECALAEGEVAGTAAARAAGRTSQVATPAKARRDRARAFAERMLQAHPVPADWWRRLPAETIVCRCEEVSLGRFQSAMAAGAGDVRSAKALTRAGMGWCQGRMCGRNCSEIVAAGGQVAAADLQAVEKRAIATPIPLGLLADWERQADL